MGTPFEPTKSGRAGKKLDRGELMRVFEADRVEVEEGDMLLLYTGWTDLLLGMNKQPVMQVLDNACCGLDGRDDKLLKWLSDSGVAALIADNYAVEGLPATPRPASCAARQRRSPAMIS